MLFNKKKLKVGLAFLFVVIFLIPINNNALNLLGTIEFPVPTQTNKLLFYIQRSTNINTIIYDANIKDGKIDPKKPLDIYWIRYTENGTKGTLNYLERVLAYGADVTVPTDTSKVYTIHFAASNKKTATFFVDSKGQAVAHMLINGKKAKLSKIFVQAHETSWLPKVSYVEITGFDLVTGAKVIERINN
ncbi:MAG TPA: DUF4833 domain-containing protein [Cytophagaceae bacterium]|jgi:hypothetical protein|nr:DUF4833 domain-containing protein [Cytophagaceae bacterium]